MKTRNNNQKTSNGNIEKMVLRSIAVIFSFAIISLTTVSAQDFWKQFLMKGANDNTGIVFVEESSEFEKADAAIEAVNAEFAIQTAALSEAFALETELDENLEIENWMIIESNFTSNELIICEEKNAELKLEDWMISDQTFENASEIITVETEAALALEDWMMQEVNFNSTEALVEKDAALELENWMVDMDNFSADNYAGISPMKLEAWMSNTSLWGF